MKKLRSLPHLPAFEAAARLSSFSAAASELFLTTGAVSRHIRSLEAELGTRLFIRGHRSVSLTRAGEDFYLTAGRALSELATAEMAICKSAINPILAVESLPTFAMHWLMPKLARFNERHPTLAVDVTTSMGPVNRNGRFDVAIRRDPAHFSGLHAVPFLREESVLVCSKSYLQTRPVIAPDRAEGHTTIHIRARSDLWLQWQAAWGTTLDGTVPPLTLDHTFAAIQAAEDGLGLAVIPLLFCARHLATGRLVSPFPELRVETGVYALLHHEEPDENIARFIAWLEHYQD